MAPDPARQAATKLRNVKRSIGMFARRRQPADRKGVRHVGESDEAMTERRETTLETWHKTRVERRSAAAPATTKPRR